MRQLGLVLRATAADDAGVRHTGGGLRLVALTVVAVGCFAVPGLAKQDPAHTPPGQATTPPGQAKKQQDAAATQQAAPATQTSAPTAAPATATPTATASATPQTKTKGNGHGASAQAQSPTNSLPPGQAKKLPPPAAPAPPAATAPAPVATTGKAAKPKARARHRRATAKKHHATTTTAGSGAVARPVTRISPATTTFAAQARKPSRTKAATSKTDSFVPRPAPKKADDATPAVVLRTVRDAVEVIPTAIWVLLGLLTALASLFAVTSARQTRRAHRLATERGELLGDVGVLQDAVLPVVPPRVGALAVSVAHRPAGGPAAGGDFYDVIPLDHGRTALVVGDVTGHGAGALSQATLVRFTLRAHHETGAGPPEALAIATESLAPHFDEGFATAAGADEGDDGRAGCWETGAHVGEI
jgi:hypothetical protein